MLHPKDGASFLFPDTLSFFKYYLYLCGVKVRNAIDAYLEHLATEQRRSPNTIVTYRTVFDDFAHFLEEQDVADIEDITSRDVRDWQALHTENGDAPNTILKRLTSLRSWFTYMRRQKWIETDVMAKISNPKRQHSLPIFFREKEVEKIYNADLFPGDLEGERDKLLLRILYETGIRRSEALGLTEASIDLGKLSIKVRGKRNKERIIPIEEELAQGIRTYLERKHQLPEYDPQLFVNADGKAISYSKVYAIVKKYMTLLSNADRISPHIFRHTFATQMLNEGASISAVKELLGHESITTTEVYTHVTREYLKDVYKHAHPRVAGKGQPSNKVSKTISH